MSMAYIWSGIVVFSVIYGFVSGTINEVGSAAIDGAEAAVTLCLGIAAVTCLWSGIAEVMRRAGIMSAIARIMKPVLRRLYPENASNDAALDAISANVSANMLGLGNAATPLGIKAAELMSHGRKNASDDLCMLIVMNSASIQLIPSTVAAVRAAAGCETPFDILPAVWLTSAISVVTGIAAVRILRKIWRGGK